MPILEARFSDPVNGLGIKIYKVVGNIALYQKTLNLLRNLDMAKKNQPRTDLRSRYVQMPKYIDLLMF